MNLPVALDAAPTTTVVVSGVRSPKHHYLDCRSCRHCYGHSRLCESPVKCEDGNRFSPREPVQLWRQV